MSKIMKSHVLVQKMFIILFGIFGLDLYSILGRYYVAKKKIKN